MGVERVLIARHGGETSAASLLLPEPRSGKLQAYLLAGEELQEVQRFKSFYSSWIVGSETLADGGVYLSTPVDPLFVVLPLLEKSRNRAPGSTEDGRFCPLDQILEHGAEQFPHLQLLADAARPLLPCVCDVKEAGGTQFFRLSDDRVLAWLLVKVDQTREALQGALGGLDTEAQLAYVIGFLAEYVSERWATTLAKQLNVDPSAIGGNAVGHVRPPPGPESFGMNIAGADEKRQRVDPKETARLAARKKAEETRASNLAKISQGTRSITSFFKPRVAS